MPEIPYHPAVFHLDLCTLSYQLHAQSLAFLFDPYYDGIYDNITKSRVPFNPLSASLTHGKLRHKVREAAGSVNARKNLALFKNINRTGAVTETTATRGMDPIAQHYTDLNQRIPGIVRAEPKKWIVYQTPPEITNTISNIYVKEYGREIYQLPSSGGGNNSLYCFEGGTGYHKDKPTFDVSLMGFVFKRMIDATKFDLHIVFRGSRSGGNTALRTVPAAMVNTGNPDWITDTSSALMICPEISQLGKPCNGFANSVAVTLANIEASLNRAIGGVGNSANINNIYISGHSLGGALALLFIGSQVLGTGFFTTIGIARKDWVRKAQVFTYGAPGVGDKELKKALTHSGVPIRRYYIENDTVLGLSNKLDSLPYLEDKFIGQRIILETGKSKTRTQIVKRLGGPIHGETADLNGEEAHSPEYIRDRMVSELRKILTVPSLETVADLPPGVSAFNPWTEFEKFTAIGASIDKTTFCKSIKDFAVEYFRIIDSALKTKSKTKKWCFNTIEPLPENTINLIDRLSIDPPITPAQISTLWTDFNRIGTAKNAFTTRMARDPVKANYIKHTLALVYYAYHNSWPLGEVFTL